MIAVFNSSMITNAVVALTADKSAVDVISVSVPSNALLKPSNVVAESPFITLYKK